MLPHIVALYLSLRSSKKLKRSETVCLNSQIDLFADHLEFQVNNHNAIRLSKDVSNH
jgi:hypothetical protein